MELHGSRVGYPVAVVHQLARFLPDRFTLLLAVLGAAHILVRTSADGAGATWDSVVYVSAADSLLAGDGLRTFDGGEFPLQPPLFPLLMAFFGLFGIEPADSGRFVNIAAFGLTIATAGFWLTRNLASRLLAVVGTAAVMVAVPLNEVSSYLWTESLFILFVLLALVQLEAFLNGKGGATAPLRWAIVFTALAAVARYTGVAMIFSGVFVLLLRRDVPVAGRLKRAGLFGALSSVPLASVLAWNWAVSGTLTGRRGVSGYSLSDSLGQVEEVFRNWAFSATASITVPNTGFLWALAGLVALGVAAQIVNVPRRSPPLAAISWWPVVPFGIFTSMYLAFIVVATPRAAVQAIDTRLLAPLCAPALLVVMVVLDRFVRGHLPARRACVEWALASPLLLGGLVSASLHAQRNFRRTAVVMDRAAPRVFLGGYNDSSWENSELIEYMKTNPIAGPIYSNEAGFLYWIAGVKAHMIWDGKRACIFPDGSHIVWWNRSRLDEAASRLPTHLLARVAERADGSIYRVVGAKLPDACFVRVGALGEPFIVRSRLSYESGHHRIGDWQWRRGTDAGGWTDITRPPTARGPNHSYTPRAEDVGYRLLAVARYRDSDGNLVIARTEPSDPVIGR